MIKFFFAFLFLILLIPKLVFAQQTDIDLSKLPDTSAAYIKLPDGKIIEKNGTTQQPAFSTIKLWVAGAVMKAAERGSLKLNDSHTVTSAEKVGGTGFIAIGNSYTYDQLLEYMLTHSDNSATNILIDTVGGLQAVDSFIKEGGYSGTTIRRYMAKEGPDNLTMAKDGVTFMENLYAKRVVSSSASDKIISILDKRTREKKDGIFIGKDASKVSGYTGKSGVGPNTRNDIGSFTSAKGRVFMVVLITAASDTTAAENAISSLAQQVITQAGGPGTSSGSTPPGSSTTSDPSKGMWCIKVGNPTTPNPCLSTNVGGGAIGDVLNWASQITAKLTRGTWGFLNQIAEVFTNNNYSSSKCPGNCFDNVYWCTYLIIDTYNLAGHKGLSRGSHAAVVNMRKWWYTEGVKQGYIYVDYPADNNLLTQVKPGYAMMMEKSAGTHTGSEHVNMVKSLELDGRGNGKLETYDSNSSSITHSFVVRNYQILNTPYPVRGFGGI